MTPETSLADLHIHTTYSDGAPSPAEVVARAVQLGLAVIAVTDHDQIDGALEALSLGPIGCQVVIGEEVTTLDGHVLGLFLTQVVRPGRTAAQTIGDIHAQGGLAIPAHPYFHLGGARGVGSGSVGLAWDAIEVENGSPGAWIANRTARRVMSNWAAAETGGSDAHILSAVGSVVTSFPGRSALDLRVAIQNGSTLAFRRNRSPIITAQTLSRTIRRKVVQEAQRRRAKT